MTSLDLQKCGWCNAAAPHWSFSPIATAFASWQVILFLRDNITSLYGEKPHIFLIGGLSFFLYTLVWSIITRKDPWRHWPKNLLHCDRESPSNKTVQTPTTSGLYPPRRFRDRNGLPRLFHRDGGFQQWFLYDRERRRRAQSRTSSRFHFELESIHIRAKAPAHAEGQWLRSRKTG